MSYLKRERQMRGDVVLFKSNGSFTDRLISWGTHGPYVHVEIDLGNGKFLGSQEKGVNIHGFEKGRDTEVFSPKVSKTNLELGLAWATRQVNDPYSYLDNVADALGFLGWRVILGQQGTYNCSNFVAHYLVAAEAEEPLGKLADSLETISRNDLARAFGILK